MTRKTLLCVIFALFATVISTRESTLTSTTYLPEVVIVGQTIEKEIYSTLVSGADSVRVLNGSTISYISVPGVDSVLAKYILAQAYWESGSFAAPLATVHNNYFGMQHPGRGKLTTSLGPFARAEGRTGYASYETPSASALDLLLLLQFYKEKVPTKSITTYSYFLKRQHYYEANVIVYTTGIKHHLLHDVNNLFPQPLPKQAALHNGARHTEIHKGGTQRSS